ncbi:MAG: T9SS type A sorting domain-containing protein [Flavobacteriales bacterium]|nr:T9SS type A sorting domain-containing protein [Flavobacteriales bacterium]
MKKLKTIFIPIAVVVGTIGLLSFTTHMHKGGDDQCKIKIIKIVDGVKTEIDSTFDCNEHLNWISSIHGMGALENLIHMVHPDSMAFQFSFDVDETDENGMKQIRISTDDMDEAMQFDFQILDEEAGKLKMIINGKEIEMDADDIHEHMKKLHEHMGGIHENTEDVDITIETDGDEKHTVQIMKTVKDGKVTIKKVVDGVETEISEDELKDLHNQHRMMFIGKDGTKAHKEVTVDVQVDDTGKKSKQVMIMTMISTDGDDQKQMPEVLTSDSRKELEMEKINFSPNPNDGKFNLNFELSKKAPVQIQIFDIQGKEVYNESIKNFSGTYQNAIDISEQGKGIYFLRIIQGNKANTNKIVID